MPGGHGATGGGKVAVEHVGGVCAARSRGADWGDAERDGGREQQRGRLFRGRRGTVQVRGRVSDGSKHDAVVGTVGEGCFLEYNYSPSVF